MDSDKETSVAGLPVSGRAYASTGMETLGTTYHPDVLDPKPQAVPDPDNQSTQTSGSNSRLRRVLHVLTFGAVGAVVAASASHPNPDQHPPAPAPVVASDARQEGTNPPIPIIVNTPASQPDWKPATNLSVASASQNEPYHTPTGNIVGQYQQELITQDRIEHDQALSTELPPKGTTFILDLLISF